MYQRSSTLYGFFCKSPAVWAAIQRQTSVQPLDHTCTAAATYWHTNTHTHTVGPRLNICPACPDSPFWTLIAASNMKTHTHIYTHILWKRWLCRYFVTPDGDVTAHSSINGQLPFSWRSSQRWGTTQARLHKTGNFWKLQTFDFVQFFFFKIKNTRAQEQGGTEEWVYLLWCKLQSYCMFDFLVKGELILAWLAN